jgi:hypothetical protein
MNECSLQVRAPTDDESQIHATAENWMRLQGPDIVSSATSSTHESSRAAWIIALPHRLWKKYIELKKFFRMKIPRL